MKELARSLRRQMTDAESKLWFHLRNRRLEGFKFRRQEIIGPYIVDFVCIEAMLIIEADGGHHADRRELDAIRTSYLESLGFSVVRFWNHAILSDMSAVLACIHARLTGTLTPAPLPEGEGFNQI
jgi:very-short-patch-repair endonuclease